MKRVIIICLSSIHFFTITIYSQQTAGEFPYRHFTAKDGLAGSNVLAFLQDTKGFIWFATSNGLSRFDGQEFKNYTTEDGLVSNNLTGLASSGDTIFISSYDKGISYWYRGKFYTYEIPNKKFPLIHHLVNDQLHLYAYGNYLYEISNHNIKNVIEGINSHPKGSNAFLINDVEIIRKGTLLFCSSYGLYKYSNTVCSELTVPDNMGQKLFTCIYKINENEILLGGEGKIWRLKNKRLSEIYRNIKLPKDKAVQHLLIDDFNNLWVSYVNYGLYLVKNSVPIDIGAKIGLKQGQINFIRKDAEGNIWVGTFGNGVFCFYNLAITNYTTKDGLGNNYILALASDNAGKILAGTFNGLNIYDGGSFKKISTGFAGSYHYIRDIQKCNNGNIFVTLSVDISENKDLKVITKLRNNNRYWFFNSAASFVTSDGSIITGGWENNVSYISFSDGLQKVKSDIKLFGTSQELYTIYKVFQDSKSRIWVGTSGGLCLISEGKQSHFNHNPVLSNTINDIQESPSGEIWIAGAGGVSVYRNGNWENYSSESTPMGQEEGFDFSSSTSVAFDKSGNTWIGNSKGLYKISSSKISRFTESFGLISNEINALYYSNKTNSLWVGTNEGLSKIDLKLLKNYENMIPQVIISEVETNDSMYYNFTNLSFKPDVKKIKVYFKAINFREPTGIIYQYKIVNKDDKWNYTENPEIQFTSPSPGSYQLQLRARAVNCGWSKPAQVTFFIATPFEKSYLFYLSIALSLTICAVFLTRKLVVLKQKKINEKKEIENKIIELKQQALAAMVNPHFIFNSLNSIQNFINHHNVKEANAFLTKFAKLIRLNLDMAQKSFITLEEEIGRLHLYLALEKMRFDDNFTYTINIGDNVLTNKLLIPNMIMQPFVENAIWHGILPGAKKGNLEISCNFDNDSNLIISIKDNGVGFDKNTPAKKSAHVSRGINIIKDRLELLNNGYLSSEVVRIISNEDETGTGTTVIITLPQSLYKLVA